MSIPNDIIGSANVAYLGDPFEQYCGLNGKPLIGGWIETYLAGTSDKYITFQDFDGNYNPFKVPLGSDGRVVMLADPSLTYDVYVKNSYGDLVCSRLNVECTCPGNISIKGADTRINNTDGTLDISLRTLGNNVRQYTINTRNKELSVQDPLYFVRNDNSATIIGFSGDGFVKEDKFEFDDNFNITGYDGSAFVAEKLDTTAFSTVSGDFLTAVDLTPYQTTAGMTAYATVESLTSKQDAGNYYSASNPSGFISEVPDTYLQNTDLTIVDNKITEISGVPLSAGDELPASVSAATDYVTATSADINSTIDNVSANSGVWGGSALPISAGHGVKVELVDNTLVFSNDETVLFETTAVNGADVCNLSESLKNFERIAVKPTRGYLGGSIAVAGGAGPWNYFDTDQIVGGTTEPFQAVCPFIMEYQNWKISQFNPNVDCTVLTWNRGFSKNMDSNTYVTADSFTASVGVQKIIGINRISGAN